MIPERRNLTSGRSPRGRNGADSKAARLTRRTLAGRVPDPGSPTALLPELATPPPPTRHYPPPPATPGRRSSWLGVKDSREEEGEEGPVGREGPKKTREGKDQRNSSSWPDSAARRVGAAAQRAPRLPPHSLLWSFRFSRFAFPPATLLRRPASTPPAPTLPSMGFWLLALPSTSPSRRPACAPPAAASFLWAFRFSLSCPSHCASRAPLGLAPAALPSPRSAIRAGFSILNPWRRRRGAKCAK